MAAISETKPIINVTPLIDILLVLLIIFMVVAPLRPSGFKARIPAEPDNSTDAPPNQLSLVVVVNADSSLDLNREKNLGTIDDPERLTERLATVFAERTKNLVFASGMETKTDQPLESRILKTVFIKAPRSMPYGQIVKVVDAVKGAGANPIGLQIDDL